MYSAFHTPTALAAVIPPHPPFLEGLEFLVSGFVVVLIVLAVMMFFMFGLGAIFGVKSKAAAASAAAKKPAPARAAAPAPVAAKASEDSRILVVLAAAAHIVLGQSARIVSVSPVSTEWGVQGRRDIFSSHKIR